MVSRSHQRPKAQLYAFNLQQIIPSIPVPLRFGEDEPILDLQSLLHKVYDRTRFELAIDYQKACALNCLKKMKLGYKV